MNKKLWNAIKNYDGQVKVGARDGSGYFYMGTGDDLRTHLDKYEEMLRRYEADRVTKARDRVEFMKSHQPDALSFVTKFEDGTSDMFLQYLDEWLNEYRRRLARQRLAEEDYRQRKRLADRQVVKEYTATNFDEGAKILIIDGGAYGAYWTFDEVAEPMKFAAETT